MKSIAFLTVLALLIVTVSPLFGLSLMVATVLAVVPFLAAAVAITLLTEPKQKPPRPASGDNDEWVDVGRADTSRPTASPPKRADDPLTHNQKWPRGDG